MPMNLGTESTSHLHLDRQKTFTCVSCSADQTKTAYHSSSFTCCNIFKHEPEISLHRSKSISNFSEHDYRIGSGDKLQLGSPR